MHQGTPSEVAEKVPDKARSGPQALKRRFIFNDVAARVKLAPFPFVMNSEFFAACEASPDTNRRLHYVDGSRTHQACAFDNQTNSHVLSNFCPAGSSNTLCLYDLPFRLQERGSIKCRPMCVDI